MSLIKCHLCGKDTNPAGKNLPYCLACFATIWESNKDAYQEWINRPPPFTLNQAIFMLIAFSLIAAISVWSSLWGYFSNVH